LITDSLEEAKAVAEKTFTPFVEKEKDAKKAFDEKNKPAEEAKTTEAAEAEDDHEEL